MNVWPLRDIIIMLQVGYHARLDYGSCGERVRILSEPLVVSKTPLPTPGVATSFSETTRLQTDLTLRPGIFAFLAPCHREAAGAGAKGGCVFEPDSLPLGPNDQTYES